MVTTRGKAEVHRYMDRLPEEIITKLLVGGGRAGGKVIATEVKERTVSEVVSENVIVRTRRDGATRVVVRITIKPGFAASLGNWEEWGTDPHFISVDKSQNGGRSVGRINKLAREPGSSHALVIGGKFVGETVFHPGAHAHPFMRVSLDVKGDEAIATAQKYINSRIVGGKIVGTTDGGSDE